MSLSTSIALEKNFDSIVECQKGTPLFYRCSKLTGIAIATPEVLVTKKFQRPVTVQVPTGYLISPGANKDKAEKAFLDAFICLIAEIEGTLPRDCILQRKLFVFSPGFYMRDDSCDELTFYCEDIGIIYETKLSGDVHFNICTRLNKVTVIGV
jgi:hypothetical protein